MDLRQIQVSHSLDGIARLGVAFFREVRNGPVTPLLRQRIDGTAQELRQALAERQLLDLESVKRTRRLYHRLGIDPTRDRPSSERLLRQVVLGQELPSATRLADLVQLASLLHQFPMAVYDWDRLVPPVLVRVGRPDESFLGPGAETVSVEGKIALVDGEGIFGSPSVSSPRVAPTSGTVRTLVLLWAAVETPKALVDEALKETVALAREFCDARSSEHGILGQAPGH